MTLLAGFAIGAATFSVLYDLRPWLKKWWDYLGRVEETE